MFECALRHVLFPLEYASYYLLSAATTKGLLFFYIILKYCFICGYGEMTGIVLGFVLTGRIGKARMVKRAKM